MCIEKIPKKIANTTETETVTVVDGPKIILKEGKGSQIGELRTVFNSIDEWVERLDSVDIENGTFGWVRIPTGGVKTDYHYRYNTYNIGDRETFDASLVEVDCEKCKRCKKGKCRKCKKDPNYEWVGGTVMEFNVVSNRDEEFPTYGWVNIDKDDNAIYPNAKFGIMESDPDSEPDSDSESEPDSESVVESDSDTPLPTESSEQEFPESLRIYKSGNVTDGKELAKMLVDDLVNPLYESHSDEITRAVLKVHSGSSIIASNIKCMRAKTPSRIVRKLCSEYKVSLDSAFLITLGLALNGHRDKEGQTVRQMVEKTLSELKNGKTTEPRAETKKRTRRSKVNKLEVEAERLETRVKVATLGVEEAEDIHERNLKRAEASAEKLRLVKAKLERLSKKAKAARSLAEGNSNNEDFDESVLPQYIRELIRKGREAEENE